MPKNWLYHIALILPVIFGVVILHTGVVDWLWYQGYEKSYYALATLRLQPQFLTFIGGWRLPVFVVAVLCWWHAEDGEGIPAQFLLLPLGYVPFTIVADILATAQVDQANFFVYPLIILPIGYAYVLGWAALVWLLTKIGLVIS